MPPANTLLIDDLLGHRQHANPAGTSIGPHGQFPVGTGRAEQGDLHLYVWRQSGAWLISNASAHSSVAFQSIDAHTHARIYLPHGATCHVLPGKSCCAFRTTDGEGEFHLLTAPVDTPAVTSPAPAPDAACYTPNEDQRLLLRALVRPLLERPAAGLARVPDVRALATELGWTIKKTNGTIDYLSNQLAKLGQAEFHSPQGSTVSRRILLAYFALDHPEMWR